MKKFNQTITIEVSVDSIAQKLLGSFNADFAHKDILAEAIIGAAVNNHTLGYVYNALNGFTNDIDFTVGQTVDCHSDRYNYEFGDDEQYHQKRVPYGIVTIVEIDLYSSKKLKVEFNSTDSRGRVTTEQAWIDHIYCSGVDLSVVYTMQA